MQTLLLPADAASIARAAELICAGKLVGFPTETVYGLGADALNASAVAQVFAAKGRPADNPLIAHVCSYEMLDRVAQLTPLAQKLGNAFWPGPLTVVLPRRDCVPDVVTAGLDTVAVRWPSHPVAVELIQQAATPIAAPSANLSGRPSPTLARHVYEDLCGRVPLILDGGAVDIGLESTVVDAVGKLPILLRPGRITREQLVELCGDCLLPDGKSSERPPAPGMKYRHYAPQGELFLVDDHRAAEALRLQLMSERNIAPLLLLAEDGIEALRTQGVDENELISLGATQEQMAARLFAALREADARKARLIIAQRTGEQGLGRAIMNRLSKAASHK